jgi:hypothetical protein
MQQPVQRVNIALQSVHPGMPAQALQVGCAETSTRNHSDHAVHAVHDMHTTRLENVAQLLADNGPT